MTSRTEAQVIRNQLRLRLNLNTDTREVHSTIHGIGVFRWMTITPATFEWYKKKFPTIPIEIIPLIIEEKRA